MKSCINIATKFLFRTICIHILYKVIFIFTTCMLRLFFLPFLYEIVFFPGIYIYIYIHRHVFHPAQDSSVWLGLTSREQLMSPECSEHQALSLANIYYSEGFKVLLIYIYIYDIYIHDIYVYICHRYIHTYMPGNMVLKDFQVRFRTICRKIKYIPA